MKIRKWTSSGRSSERQSYWAASQNPNFTIHCSNVSALQRSMSSSLNLLLWSEADSGTESCIRRRIGLRTSSFRSPPLISSYVQCCRLGHLFLSLSVCRLLVLNRLFTCKNANLSFTHFKCRNRRTGRSQRPNIIADDRAGCNALFRIKSEFLRDFFQFSLVCRPLASAVR